MVEQLSPVLGVLNSLAALLGIFFISRSWRAYRRTGSHPMLVLSTSMALLVLAVLAEGFLYGILHWSLDQAHAVEAGFNVAAFAFFAYSLHAPEKR